MERIEVLLRSLRQKGYRIGKGRKAVLEALLESTQPVAALELHARLLRTACPVDRVTVYRELTFLSDIGLVHRVRLKDNVGRYELAPESGHRHHLICTTCKHVQDVDMTCEDLHALEGTIGKKADFVIRDHSLEFYGLCSRCA